MPTTDHPEMKGLKSFKDQPLRMQANFWFSRFAASAARLVGSPYMFIAAVAAVLIWALSGRRFGYSDTWQLIINTGTTILTFLIVFLIQNTQNRDAKAIHLKLDELLHAHHDAKNEMIDIEKLSDAELDELERRYERIREATAHRRQKRDRNHPAA